MCFIRNQIALQIDHVRVMNLIESTMVQVFAERKANESTNERKSDNDTITKDNNNNNDKKDNNNNNDTSSNTKEQSKDDANDKESRQVSLYGLKPFYLVDSIFNGSPAQEAGLKSGDLVIQFGSMVNENKSPQLLQEIVKTSINKPIPVTIKRNPEGFLGLQLTPKQWSGKGLLGCHLTPYQE